MAQAQGATVVISKGIGHNLRIPALHTILPEARFIDLTRDGCAVAASLLHVDWWSDNSLWWYGGTPQDAAREGHDPIDIAATHWVREVRAIDSGLEHVPEEQVLRLRYEELVADPIGVLGEAASFAGLPPHHRWSAALEDLRFPNKNLGSNRLGDAARRVQELQSEEMAARGYVD